MTLEKFKPYKVTFIENDGVDPIFPAPHVKMFPNARLIKSTLLGPTLVGRYSQIGPEVTSGSYMAMNMMCYAARCTIGSYCTFGGRTSINPLNHPTDWLSIHEFQYNKNPFDWVDEYRNLERKPHYATITDRRSVVGSDVWLGHNAMVLEGVNVGDGAVIGAGAIVTEDVPPYAIVAGVPAKILKFRFPENIIERLLETHWWDLGIEDLSGLPFDNIENCLDILEDMSRT
jgi:acetyltransferase-like isoleucine patch superfamily enzyme